MYKVGAVLVMVQGEKRADYQLSTGHQAVEYISDMSEFWHFEFLANVS